MKKIFHRKIQRNSYKYSPLSAHSMLKDAGALLFTANLTLFFDKTSYVFLMSFASHSDDT